MAGIRHVEQTVSTAADLEGVVLRYGGFYGPGTENDLFELVRKRRMPIVGSGAGMWSFVHIEDAAAATVLALDHGAPGIYNIVDDEPAPVSDWLPYLAQCLGAKPPRRIPAWVGRIAAGPGGVAVMTQARGASNAKAKRELGWTPAHPTWHDGFGLAPARATVPDGILQTQ